MGLETTGSGERFSYQEQLDARPSAAPVEPRFKIHEEEGPAKPTTGVDTVDSEPGPKGETPMKKNISMPSSLESGI